MGLTKGRKVRTRTGENEPDPYMDLQPRPEGDRTYQEMAITSTASSKTPGERRLPSPNLIYPPSPTDTYSPRDYLETGNRDSITFNELAQYNGHVKNLGNEERQAVDELVNAVRDYDDSPSTGDVRLVDGSSTLEGRVEVYYDNLWGTICNRGWDSTDSGVVCRQLGFQVSLSSPSFGPGIPTQRIWLADVQCESSDRRLNECVTDGQWGQTSTCPHNNDVGVRCSGLNVGIAPNYRGCYRFEDSALSHSALTFPANTIETCLQSCSINFMFAGLYGTTCVCGDQIKPSAQPVDNTMCRTPCPGNSAQLCGDTEVNMEVLSVYSVSVGDGYVSSPWFPGNYVLSGTDTSRPDNLISRTDVTASSGMLLIRILAFDLAPGDTLSVEVGGMTINPTTFGETVMSGLPETTLVLTATLTRAVNSAGSSGYIITFTNLTFTLHIKDITNH
ncbi:uncharacterized protein LOC105439904 [Strongylocentrotus purpuratus]|uniref:Uncharacterized protein n=1 Tax=Strongylocentrotus purpuratus TaxID=7668 RepID=A0A7M7NPT2_STRPU|nr:uncharacterized protein LOC105439904 [Strongylocentrotus purpuratus]